MQLLGQGTKEQLLLLCEAETEKFLVRVVIASAAIGLKIIVGIVAVTYEVISVVLTALAVMAAAVVTVPAVLQFVVQSK